MLLQQNSTVLEPLEVFGGFGEGFGIAILGVEIMVTFLPIISFYPSSATIIIRLY
jgi:hypothetical protein